MNSIDITKSEFNKISELSVSKKYRLFRGFLDLMFGLVIREEMQCYLEKIEELDFIISLYRFISMIVVVSIIVILEKTGFIYSLKRGIKNKKYLPQFIYKENKIFMQLKKQETEFNISKIKAIQILDNYVFIAFKVKNKTLDQFLYYPIFISKETIEKDEHLKKIINEVVLEKETLK